MAYTALYRKLRPTTFDGVVGQKAIVRALRNQIISARVSHAYLFCGTRGTGKTTAAKIFARAINCESPADGSPCNACPSCKAILADASSNVIEIDAASNNGVDNIREIREETRYAPAEGRYKVYIVDEVHMLSTGAFNALLKTLEEPPGYVVFILATTDPQKLPATILSRVQRFDFARVPMDDMAEALRGYMAAEALDIDDDALLYACRAADGAMRDALSILDQAASYYHGERITLGKLTDALGAVDSAVFFQLAAAINQKDAAACLTIIDAAASKGREFGRMATDLIGHLRDLLVAGLGTKSNALAGLPEDHKAALAKQAKTIGGAAIMRYIDKFSALSATLRHASEPRVAFEVACLSLCMPEEVTEPTQPRKQKTAAPQPEEPPKTVAKAVPEDIRQVAANWQAFAASLPVPESGYAKASEVGYMEDNDLYIVCESAAAATVLKNKSDMLKAELAKRFNKDFDLRVMSKALYNSQHKHKYGAEDAFDYAAAINEMSQKLGGIKIETD